MWSAQWRAPDLGSGRRRFDSCTTRGVKPAPGSNEPNCQPEGGGRSIGLLPAVVNAGSSTAVCLEVHGYRLLRYLGSRSQTAAGAAQTIVCVRPCRKNRPTVLKIEAAQMHSAFRRVTGGRTAS